MEKVLVAIDGYEASLGAIKKAVEIAGRYGAEVVAVQVEEDVPLLPMEKEAESVNRIREQQVPFFSAPLDLATAYGQQNGVSVRQVKAKGIITAVILKIAQDLGVDMIIIGDSGRRGLQKLHFGSVSESVVRTSQIPVLVIKKGSLDLIDLVPLMTEIADRTVPGFPNQPEAAPGILETSTFTSTFRKRMRFSFGLLGLYALIYFLAALFTSAPFKELAQVGILGLPFGIWLGLSAIVGGLGITRVYLAKETRVYLAKEGR